ncbi:Subtilase family protein [Salipiger thiooxidans]|uniref:Subtilase family protein n=1 Tax=Salipiger thiooxidans TaxID=282683 RepID=A0A1G7BGG9_9RHOB|nr:S8 family serine peptidase [Salipiger thiooxidans]SDE25536.1 Subtilase family protein [Salipiger thiooxidans]
MTLTWADAEPNAPRDPYVQFSWMLRQRHEPPLGTHIYQPIFVRLHGGDPLAERRELLKEVLDPLSPLLMDPFELELLAARCGPVDPDAGMPDEYALYWKLDTPEDHYVALFNLQDTGTPVALDPTGLNTEMPETSPRPDEIPPEAAAPGPVRPIVAIIDDGIGFLNARFRREDRTRFHAIWLQSLERRGRTPRSVILGEVLTRDEIDDQMLSQGSALSEITVYNALNAKLSLYDGFRSTDHGSTHGTHVLDLAAGADPADGADEVRDWPLIGVQLPPQAIADTSGTKMESYLIQAVRWVLRQAHVIDPTAPVIVNLSLGMLAGPKDGTRFADYQITREAEAWERVKNQPVRIVWSFGNDYRKRLVARLDYERRGRQSIDWIVQTGDQTETYMEVRPIPGQSLKDVSLSLETPAGPASGFGPVPPGCSRDLKLDGKTVGRIYHVPERHLDPETLQRPYYLLALSPTASAFNEPLAPAGTWKLVCRYKGKGPLSLILQIQRDDSLIGYRPKARQSYFDNDKAYGWSEEYLDHRKLLPDCVIRHEGTFNALASSTARQVFHTGAAQLAREMGLIVPSVYTGEGAEWAVPGPSAATIADRSRIHPGVKGAGTFSSSTRFRNGTSAAAGRLTRALGLSAARLEANATTPKSYDFDPDKLTIWPVPAPLRSRLGDEVIQPFVMEDAGSLKV